MALQKSLETSSRWLSNFALHLHFEAANFVCDVLRIMPEIVSKLLRAAITGRAVRLESEQTPLSQTSRQFRSAALHRIRFGTREFVPTSHGTPYFHSQTNEWSKHWAQQFMWLWLVTSARKLHRNFISHEKILVSDSSRNLQSIKPFDSRISFEW